MTAQADEITRSNPYVGPRPFRIRDKAYFFGRERETIDLRDLLIARRVVLLFSPSGAGKTSLLQAGVIPDMCTLGYTGFAPLRVSSEVPPELNQKSPNRYLFSTLVSLEESLPEEERLPISELAEMSLVDYLDQNRARMICEEHFELDIGQVLIFDQFEELLSLNPADISEKQAFLKSLAPVLADPRYFALFAMREDYVASMDPYLRLIPDRLATRYRVGLLSENAALEAVCRPSSQVEPPVEFHRAAAEELIADLRQILLRQVDGPPQLTHGPYIEPIMLQVVCHGLWEKRRNPDEITLDDLHQLRRPGQEWLGDRRGDPDLARMTPVDLSLGSYYAAKVAEVARNTLPVEHKIRDWFDSQLISTQGLRSIVLQGVQESQGLDNALISELVDAHLVRAEPRRGLLWYELIHDRFIEPVRQNNASWFKEKLKPLQRQALLWEREGRPQNLLLSGQPLVAAETWVKREKPGLTKSEQDLLNASQDAVAAERREVQRLRIFVVVVMVLAMLAGGLAIYSNYLSNQANQEKTRALNAEADAVTAQADALALSTESKQNEYVARTAEAQAADDRSAAILSEATATAALADAVAGRATADAALALNISAEATREAIEYAAQEAQGQAQEWLARKLASEAQALAPTDPDLAALLSVEAYCAADSFDARHALLTSLQTGAEQQIKEIVTLPRSQEPIAAIAFSPDGEHLAWVTSGGAGGEIVLWNVKAQVFENLPPNNEHFTAVTFSPDGQYLVAASRDTAILIFQIDDLAQTRKMRTERPVFSLAFHPGYPEDPRLAAGIGTEVWLFDFADPLNSELEGSGQWMFSQDDYIYALAWSPGGSMLASGDAEGGLWITAIPDAGTATLLMREFALQDVSSGVVYSVAWSPDNKLLASAGSDNNVTLWDIATFSRLEEPLSGHGIYDTVGVSFSADGNLLASVGNDDNLVIWDVKTRKQVARLDGFFLDNVSSVAFSPVPGTAWLAAGSTSRQISLFDVQPAVPLYIQIVTEYSTEGRLVALGWDSVSEDGALFGLLAGEQDWTLVRVPSLEESTPQWEAIQGAGTVINSATFSPDGRYLALGQSSESIAEVWELSPEMRVVERIDYSTPEIVEIYSPLRSLTFEPDGPGLTAGLCNFDKYVPDLLQYGEGLRCAESQNFILLRAGPAAQHWERNAHSDYIDALAFDPLNRYLASGGQDQSILIWELLEGVPSAIVKTIDTPQAVNALAWSPDGQMMAASFVNGSLQLYHVPTFLPLGSAMRSPGGEINSMIFHEGNDLITSSGRAALLRWLSTPNDWGVRACESAGRILTTDEWAAYLRDEPYAPACQNLETPGGAVANINICGN